MARLESMLGVLVAVLWLGAAVAGAIDPDVKCEAGKNKAAGRYALCCQKAEAKYVKTGKAAKYATALAKCDAWYSKKWQKLEAKALEAGSACMTVGDEAAGQTFIRAHTDAVAAALAGAGFGSCGDGVANGAEQCDGADLGGASCAALGYLGGGTLACLGTCRLDRSGCSGPCRAFPATGQTTTYKSGDDGDVQAGATLSYTDNGDGTITDNNTGLMWEKLSDDGSIHDQDNVYIWDDAFDVHVAGLNTSIFAGYTDWRLPNVKELQSIVDYERYTPSVDPVFNAGCTNGCTVTTCSCTASSYYWSSTTYALNSTVAWYVGFDNGYVVKNNKATLYVVRAVRGGL